MLKYSCIIVTVDLKAGITGCYDIDVMYVVLRVYLVLDRRTCKDLCQGGLGSSYSGIMVEVQALDGLHVGVFRY